MRAIGFEHFGDPTEVLKVLELPEPHAGTGQVRVRTVAADIKVSETLLCTGALAGQLDSTNPTPTNPAVAGWDLAGVIDEVGPGVENRFTRGDAVIAIANSYAGRGAHAEYVIADAASVVSAPKGRSFVEAATFLTNALTARVWLDALELEPGQTVAVTGAAGTVGGFAVELAKLRGLRVVVDAKESDRPFLVQLNADVILNRSPNFVHEVITTVGPVHGLIDAANIGDNRMLQMVESGRLAVSARMQTGDNGQGVKWVPVYVGDFTTRTDLLNEMRDHAEKWQLTLRVADIFLPERAAAAYQRLMQGGVRGRLAFAF